MSRQDAKMEDDDNRDICNSIALTAAVKGGVRLDDGPIYVVEAGCADGSRVRQRSQGRASRLRVRDSYGATFCCR